MLKLQTGFNLQADLEKLEFQYGEDVFGPITEKRYLDDIRQSLSNPDVEGPNIVYAVAMDVGKKKHLADLKKRNLLYGAMIFDKGVIGEEPVRSQGHIHAVSLSCKASTCEVYEIWAGKAIIYMQETANDDPGKCYAVHANQGDVVIVPPGWAHCTINADPSQAMLFGAWCIRDFGFDYEDIRKHQGVAFFPKMCNNQLEFVKNPNYATAELIHVKARTYPEFQIQPNIPIYTQYEHEPDLFTFVTNPQSADEIWKAYRP